MDSNLGLLLLYLRVMEYPLRGQTLRRSCFPIGGEGSCDFFVFLSGANISTVDLLMQREDFRGGISPPGDNERRKKRLKRKKRREKRRERKNLQNAISSLCVCLKKKELLKREERERKRERERETKISFVRRRTSSERCVVVVVTSQQYPNWNHRTEQQFRPTHFPLFSVDFPTSGRGKTAADGAEASLQLTALSRLFFFRQIEGGCLRVGCKKKVI